MSENGKIKAEGNHKKATLFLGKLVWFNSALKLYHWNVFGKASYAQHIAIDQALTDLRDYTDNISEISYAMFGNLDIIVPEAKTPEAIIDFVKEQIDYIDESRSLYSQIFMQSILDDFQQTLEQLMYRLKRLS